MERDEEVRRVREERKATPINTIIPTHTGTSHLISHSIFPNPLHTTHLNPHTSPHLTSPHTLCPTVISLSQPLSSHLPTLTSPSNPHHTTHLNPHTSPHLSHHIFLSPYTFPLQSVLPAHSTNPHLSPPTPTLYPSHLPTLTLSPLTIINPLHRHHTLFHLTSHPLLHHYIPLTSSLHTTPPCYLTQFV
ncbi:hypothetical protein Pcinc_023657 [Petrolisthes cinctipes]|uniref:Uncharacterized protein n=1 Tax=Petrolisthes cinctipes TaxID=88211 RepID=A0AAE1FCQ2_PETCI|nr:hypothetical protein Pcinc_023657 [Petrolisthes cinctipes]